MIPHQDSARAAATFSFASRRTQPVVLALLCLAAAQLAGAAGGGSPAPAAVRVPLHP